VIMKILKYFAALTLLALVSCTKNFDKLNTNPNQLNSPDMDPVLTQVFKMTADRSETENLTYFWDYQNIITPFGYDRYSANDDALWSDFYVTGIGNLMQLNNLYGSNPAFKNRNAIVDIWSCYLYSYLVGTYGPIPYSKVGTASFYIPYDDENPIYISLLSRLTADYNTIDPAGDKLTTDIIFAGDMSKWKKFANALRLRIAIRCQRNVPDQAVATIKDVMTHEADLPASDGDDAKVQYGISDGSQSPYWTKYLKAVTASANYPVMGDFVFTYFRSYNDPRMSAYFNQSAAGFSITDTLTSTADAFHHVVTYKVPYLGEPKASTLISTWGLTIPLFNGANQTDSYSTLPGANAKTPTTPTAINVLGPDRPFYFMTYSEVCFLEAEAAALGYGGSQTADKYYYNGINANMTLWGVTPAQVTAYEATPGIQWGTAGKGFNYPLGLTNASIPADNFTKIWVQEWLSGYPDAGFETWCLFRRTQCVVIPPNTNPATPNLSTPWGNLPDRWQYPTTENTRNPQGVADGVKLLGAYDYPQTVLKFAKPYTPINWGTAHAFYDYTELEKWYGKTIQSLTAAGITYTETSKY
jgi:hypothetical protein